MIGQLATIEIKDNTLQQLDVTKILDRFHRYYKKLDDLKSFRNTYEQKNTILKWWDSDELRNAQLDSSEVQAAFSKAIGELMLLSIMQAKKLTEQQSLLFEQQIALKKQAENIAEHTGELVNQHRALADQSDRLETLVREYFELKGLTDDGAQKLIEIAGEIKVTKTSMLEEFDRRTGLIEATSNQMSVRMDEISAQIYDRIRQSTEQQILEASVLRQETKKQLREVESVLRTEQATTLTQKIADHSATVNNILQPISRRVDEQTSQLTNAMAIVSMQRENSRRTKRLEIIVTWLSVVLIASLVGAVHLLNLV